MASAEAEWCGFGGLIRAEVVLGKLPMGFVALRCEYNAISTSVCVYDQHVGPLFGWKYKADQHQATTLFLETSRTLHQSKKATLGRGSSLCRCVEHAPL